MSLSGQCPKAVFPAQSCRHQEFLRVVFQFHIRLHSEQNGKNLNFLFLCVFQIFFAPQDVRTHLHHNVNVLFPCHRPRPLCWLQLHVFSPYIFLPPPRNECQAHLLFPVEAHLHGSSQSYFRYPYHHVPVCQHLLGCVFVCNRFGFYPLILCLYQAIRFHRWDDRIEKSGTLWADLDRSNFFGQTVSQALFHNQVQVQVLPQALELVGLAQVAHLGVLGIRGRYSC